MTRRAAVGDIHLSGFQSDTVDKDGLPYRLGLIIKILKSIVRKCRAVGVTDIDLLGDLENDKSIIYNVAQDAFKEFLIENADINFKIISGNHDMSSTGDNQKSAISVFSEYKNVKCIMYQPEIIGNITYVPYTDKFMDVIHTLPPGAIFISHLGLNEAMLQSGLSKVDKISIKDLTKFKLILLGHYHKPQMLVHGSSTVYYPGSILHKDWNDKNEKKQFLLYNDCEPFNVEIVPIEGFPEFHEYIITTKDQIPEILKKAEIDRNAGHQVRIRNSSAEKIKDEISGGVLVLEQQEIDITNRGINIAQTKEEQLKKYLEIKNIPEAERAEYLSMIAKYDLLKKDKE